MFYWMKRTRGGSEALDGLGNMSKSDILRGIVNEKLTTAAQEILAVVERTVAGYEEEAAGFRREIDRQRRQLEVLLQPRVTLEKRALIQEEEIHDVVVLSEEEEEERPKQPSGAEDTESLGLWFDEYEDDDNVGDEERASVHLTSPSSRQRKEDLKDPDFQITPRLISSKVRPGKRKPGRPRLSESQNHLDLKIRILESSQIDVLSNRVFPNCPLHDLRCPRGLQEAEFLERLRLTFPQLANQESFEFFTTDKSRRLFPLVVTTRTPEEICRSIRLSGSGKSALYIRIKTAGDPQASSDGVNLMQGEDVSPSTSADQTLTGFASPGVSSEKRKRGRPRLGEEPTHYRLRICMLEDSTSDVLSKEDMLKSPIQDLSCPRGLQEEDFLSLLRSTFPRLADEKPFQVFKSDRSRRLQRLPVTSMTPDEIFRSMRSTGVEKAVLYLRLKTGEEEEEVHLQKNSSDSPETSAVKLKTDEGGLTSRSLGQLVASRASVLSSSSKETENVDDGDAAESQGDSSDNEEAKDRDEEWKPDPEESRSKTKRGRGVKLMEASKDPCRVCGVAYSIQSSLVKHAWNHVEEAQRLCGVCGENFESVDQLKEHLRNYQETHDCAFCGKSFLTITGLEHHTTRHTGDRPFKCDICSKAFAHRYALGRHRWVHAPVKPHKCDVCSKEFSLKATLQAHKKTHASKVRYNCPMCGKSLSDLRSLARHKATHSGERRFGCEVCGKRFKLLYTLKAHEKTHESRERLFLCHICCKSFFSNCGLKAHMRTHSDVRPFPCGVCGKGFVSNGERKVHMRIHTGEAPYGCSQCGRYFKRKTHLNSHLRSHLGLKLFVCSVCGKACSRQEHLNVHMRTHNGERPYQCNFCDKAFTQGHCLKTHIKTHHHQETQLMNALKTKSPDMDDLMKSE
ncbi:zinc finger protein 252-like [Cheilinus undulatus]|uniref:zinc finger protein 252-like n=1 Tax=Cheilinus undulatus TaxID=241271 RepID=UPI001BD2CDE6|nr:zinc finger protein 252-like [Cheilinus undulatus]